jgi:hypothetical protein
MYDVHNMNGEHSPLSYTVDAEDTDAAISAHASIERVP